MKRVTLANREGKAKEVNVKFSFTEKDVRELLQNVTEYSEEEKRRVEAIVCAQIRKYTYLF